MDEDQRRARTGPSLGGALASAKVLPRTAEEHLAKSDNHRKTVSHAKLLQGSSYIRVCATAYCKRYSTSSDTQLARRTQPFSGRGLLPLHKIYVYHGHHTDCESQRFACAFAHL